MVRMQILDDEKAIAEAQAAFKAALSRASVKRMPTTIGHPSGSVTTEVYWLPSFDLWAYFGFPPGGKSIGKRYWNAFGLGKPSSSVSIDCEVNPPIHGINRRPGGAFAEADGQLYVLHRGNFNAFRGRIPKDFTRRNFDGLWISAADGHQETDLLKVGRIEDRSFVADVAHFVTAAAHLKKLYKGKA